MNTLIASSVVITLWGLLALIAMVLVALFFLDLRLIKMQKMLQKIPRRKHNKLTVLIYARNNGATITQSLQALRKTGFRALELVVIDNASSDNTRQNIKAFQKEHPKFTLRTIFKTKASSKEEAVNQALKKTNPHSAILVLEGDCIADKKFIATTKQLASAQLITETGIALPVLPAVTPSHLSVAHSYVESSKYLLQKATIVAGWSASLADKRKAYLLPACSKLPAKLPQLAPASYLGTLKHIPTGELPEYQAHTAVLRFAGLTLASYVVWLAVSCGVIEPLMVSFGLLFLWLVIQLVAVPGLTRTERWRTAFALPLAFPLLYVVMGLSLIWKNPFIKTKLTTRVLN